MSELEIRNLSHRFSAPKKILDDVSLRLDGGKIYALMGANGSGKTTLFNIITGFLEPVSGDIFFKSERITRLPSYRINRIGIGRTFQDLRLLSKLTVFENILLAMKDDPTQAWYKALLPGSLFSKKLNEMEEGANQILEAFFLTDVRNSLAAEISYGQQKLLNIACCVANDASLLLLDEPIAGVNPHYQERITGLLKGFGNQGKTIFLIEHNTEFLQQIANRFYFLRHGKIYSYETFAQLREDKRVLDAYLST